MEVNMKIRKTKKMELAVKNHTPIIAVGSRRTLVSVITFTLVIAILSGMYLIDTWNRYQHEASSEATVLAQTLETFMRPGYIAELSGRAEDLMKPEYTMLKKNMEQLVKITNSIYFAYLLIERNNDILILLNSDPAELPDYLQPRLVFSEADRIYHEPFSSGRSVLTEPVSDRWGTWISALVPVKDPSNGKTIAVFGIDYDASEWYAKLWARMFPDIIIAICILILSFTLLYGCILHSRMKVLSRKLSYDEALYHSIFEQAPIGIAIANSESCVIQPDYDNFTINSMFEKILGRTKQNLTNIKWTEITHPDDLPRDLEKFEQFLKGEISGYSLEKRYLKPDGTSVWTNITISSLLGGPARNSMYICIVEDISKRKTAEIALKESERKQAMLISHLPGLAYRCNYDREWTMQYVSDGCYYLTGYSPDSLLDNRDLSYNDLIAPEYRESLWNEWKRILDKRQSFKFEYEITTATGKRKWVLEIGQGVYTPKGEVEALEGIILDISDRKLMENSLKYINEHDRWTGLYNRDYLEILLKNDIRGQSALKRAVVCINMTTVQLLTANYGFHYTQSLIKKAAKTLSMYCTDRRLLFKTYENRFVFYLKEYKDKTELIEFCEIIAKALESLLRDERIGGGIGVFEIDPKNGEDEDQILKKLLIASEQAINFSDINFGICFYDKDFETLVNREGEIRQALSMVSSNDDHCGGLFLQYQPIIDLKTNSICGFEALARLRTEMLGLISPAEFIPIAEKTKLIIPMGEKVIVNAFLFLNMLKEHGYDTINVSINVSAIQLFRPDFISRLLGTIRKMCVNPKNIGIEITESVFTSDYDEINSIISKLKDIGLHVAIDDFGTGYSTLARERELNVNCLKIDKSFIDKLLVVNPERAITGDIISIAHKLGHCVIAEGVEYESQLQYLRDHGCDKIQGYLLGKPLHEEAAIELLNRHRITGNGDHSSDICCE